MVTRRTAAALVLLLGLAGCANNPAGSSAAPNPSTSAVIDLPAPSTDPSIDLPSKPVVTGTETISGTVVAGVEPGCLLLQGAKGSHLLNFSDPAMRADAPVGAKVTVTGRSEPTMMTTCQQGVPFIVTAVRASS